MNNKNYVDITNLGKASPWKEVSFTYDAQEFTVECKKVDRLESIIDQFSMDVSPEVADYQKNIADLATQKPDDYEAVEQQMYEALTLAQRQELAMLIRDKKFSRIVNRVRLPQADGSVIHLSLDGADGTANINDFDPDFVEALDQACDAVNNPSEVKAALDTFPESGGDA